MNETMHYVNKFLPTPYVLYWF